MKPKTTWVLVADAGTATVWCKAGANGRLAAVEGGQFDAPRSHGQDIYADDRGRSFESVGGQRHGMERPTSPEDQGRAAFARLITGWLERPGAGQHFDCLAIAAEPKMLGALRSHLPAALRDKVVAELHKDLTKATPEEIARAFADKLAL